MSRLECLLLWIMFFPLTLLGQATLDRFIKDVIKRTKEKLNERGL